MSYLVKIGHTFLNLDRVLAVEDRFPSERENTVVVRYGAGPHESLFFAGSDADDLRTWLNTQAVNRGENGSGAPPHR